MLPILLMGDYDRQPGRGMLVESVLLWSRPDWSVWEGKPKLRFI